jgi:hypothetical protein
MCPSTEDFVLLQSSTTYGSTTYSSSKNAGTKQTNSKHWLMRNWNCHLQLRCHMIITLKGIYNNKPRQKMMDLVSIMQQMTNDADRTQPSPIQHRTWWERKVFSIFTWTSWRFLHAYSVLLVDATMKVLLACWRGSTKPAMAAQTPTTTYHGQKAWSSLTTVESSTKKLILLKIERAPIDNLISNTYCTVSVKLYWELTHWANPNIHRTPQ